MLRKELHDVRRRALVGHLAEAGVHRIPRIRQLQHAAIHGHSATHHRVTNLEHAAAPSPDAGFITKDEVHRIAKLRVCRSRHRVDATAVRKADETFTDFHQVGQVTIAHHRLQGPVNIRRLLLRSGEQLNQSGTTRHTHRLTSRIHVHETARATPIGAAERLATLGPTAEHARPNTLKSSNSRTERRLAQLLPANDLTSTPLERRSLTRPSRIIHRIRLHPIKIDGVIQLPADKLKRLAQIIAIRHNTVRGNPIGKEKTKGLRNDRLFLLAHSASSF